MSEENQTPEQPEVTEEMLLGLGLGIVPATDEQTPETYPEADRIKLIDGSEMNYAYHHVYHWMNTQAYERIVALHPRDKDRYFQMVTDYADLISHILNDDTNVIYEYAKGSPTPWAKLENYAKETGIVIDYDKIKAFVQQYIDWRKSKGLK